MKAIVIILCIVYSCLAWAEPPVILRGPPKDAAFYQVYDDFVAKRSIASIKEFSVHPQPLPRIVVDYILLQQALLAGGMQAEVNILATKNYYNLSMDKLSKGHYLMQVNTIWQQDALPHQQHVHISAPLIDKGTFEAALFTSPTNVKAFELANDPNKISRLTAISNQQWSADWLTLSHLGLRRLEHTELWVNMFRAVENEMVDIMLHPFNLPADKTLRFSGRKLKIIPYVKVKLEDSMHFVLAKKHPDAPRVIKYLDSGLAILKAKGIVDKAYRQIGLISDEASDWVVLNQDSL